MALNARQHTIPAGSDTSVSRATIFQAFGNSIHDVVPVANATARAALVSDLDAAGQDVTSTNPLVVLRGDAPGLHRLEYSYDGSVWLTASGRLAFASKSAADSWATANGSLLSMGDECWVGSANYAWDGTAWRGGDTTTPTFLGIYASSGASPVKVTARGGRAFMEGIATSSSATFTTGTNYDLCTIPASMAPATDRLYLVSVGNANSCRLVVQPDGDVIFAVLSGFTGTASIGLDSVTWRIGN